MAQTSPAERHSASDSKAQIKYLIERKFEDVMVEWVVKEALGEFHDVEDPEDPEAVRFAQQLLALTPSELQAWVQAEKELELREQQEADAAKLKTGFALWSMKAYWTADEAATLLSGMVPGRSSVRAGHTGSRAIYAQSELADLIRRAIEAGLKADPGSVLSWAKRNAIPVPPVLEAEVRSREHTIEDLNQTIAQLTEQRDGLLNRVSELEHEIQKCQAADASLGARERTTFSKLVVGMALAKYGYDPSRQRQGTAGKIESSLRENGIEIDQDTVKSKLDEAVGELRRMGLLKTKI